jgi:electron transfer flavoprotein beta subunit
LKETIVIRANIRAIRRKKMKILVGVKRVVDYAVKVRVSKATNSVDLTHLKMSPNPFCEIAVEEAIRIKETQNKQPIEVVAVSIGPKNGTPETIKAALAMGADRGIHVVTPDSLRTDYFDLQSAAVAQIFKKIVENESVNDPVGLVLLGKQAIDSDSGATGPMLAALLDWPQVTYAAKLTVESSGPAVQDYSMVVERETDKGSETLRISQFPAVVTCDLR